MENNRKDDILYKIKQLNAGNPGFDAVDGENLVLEILTPLLAEEGYTVCKAPISPEVDLNFIAKKPATTIHDENVIGIQYKHYRRDEVIENSRALHYALSAIISSGIGRAILVTNASFNTSFTESIQRAIPISLEVMDINSLYDWLERIDIEKRTDITEVELIIKTFSARFALLIAEDPRNLDNLEWRDIERTLAEVFDGLGFSVLLTPGSKDGGKDIILRCVVSGVKQSYLVEVKHWRSRGRVGQSSTREFLNVIVREQCAGGLFLSTYGYTQNAFQMLSEIEHQKIRFGTEQKIVALCKTYTKIRTGIWSPPESLTQVLFEQTIGANG